MIKHQYFVKIFEGACTYLEVRQLCQVCLSRLYIGSIIEGKNFPLDNEYYPFRVDLFFAEPYRGLHEAIQEVTEVVSPVK